MQEVDASVEVFCVDFGLAMDLARHDALTDAVDAAAQGVEYTKTIIATKGRASYLKERSLGHQDPGATSSLYMLQAASEVLQRA